MLAELVAVLRRRRQLPALQRPRRSARPSWSPSGRRGPEIPDPDPLGVVYFADADPVFAARRARQGTGRLPPEPCRPTTIRRTHRGGPQRPADLDGRRCRCSPATSPPASWVSSSSATGSGRPKSSTRSRRSPRCSPRLQARVVAEEQLRYLAEHDDLTGLNNRRALLAHLDDRLRGGPAGPGVGTVPRPRPAQGDQRLPRPHTPATGSSGSSPNGCARRPARPT